MTAIPEDMSELVDVSIDRVDLVGKAANGHRFLLAKSADSPNLISPETVRELIKEADAAPDSADLEAFEGIASVLKAGRALSSANESTLRSAAEAIQKVLASLPAPEEAPVEKETPVAEETTDTTEAPEAAVEKEAVEETAVEETAVEKEAEAPSILWKEGEPSIVAADTVEKGGALMAVYDASGKLVGVIKPSHLTVVESGASEAAEPAAKEEEVEVEAAAEDADEVEPEDGAPAEALGDDELLIPGTETVQSPIEKSTETVVNVTQAPDVAALLKEALAPLVEKIAHAADLAGEVKVLKERVEAYGREPDDRKSPLLNGADGVAGIAKRSAANDELAELTKSVALAKEAGDPTAYANAQQALAFAAIKNRFQPS